jgi:hypothetical protein
MSTVSPQMRHGDNAAVLVHSGICRRATDHDARIAGDYPIKRLAIAIQELACGRIFVVVVLAAVCTVPEIALRRDQRLRTHAHRPSKSAPLRTVAVACLAGLPQTPCSRETTRREIGLRPRLPTRGTPFLRMPTRDPIVLQGCRRLLEDAGVETVLEARDPASGY